MQILTTIALLATAGYTIAAPTAIPAVVTDAVTIRYNDTGYLSDQYPADMPTVRINSRDLLSKRDTTQCGVDYPRLTDARVANIVSQLSGENLDFLAPTGTQGWKLTCIGGTGLFWSIDAQNPTYNVIFNSQNIAPIINNAFDYCFERYPSSKESNTQFDVAYQFFGNGWNLLLHGSAC